jgi:phenylalanyl-tRNA synthetase beta chain
LLPEWTFVTPAEEMKTLCTKVQLGPPELLENDTVLEVTVPPTHSDILHAVDIAEDIGIAFGYNNIRRKVPMTCTVGGEFPLDQIGDLLREEIALVGYTGSFVTRSLQYSRQLYGPPTPRGLRLPCLLPTRQNVEYQVVRTTMFPGLLKTLQHNKASSFTAGFKLFESSDVVLANVHSCVVAETIVGAKNARRVCAVYAGPMSGFEIIHGLINRIMPLTEVAPDSAMADEGKFRVSQEGWCG